MTLRALSKIERPPTPPRGAPIDWQYLAAAYRLEIVTSEEIKVTAEWAITAGLTRSSILCARWPGSGSVNTHPFDCKKSPGEKRWVGSRMDAHG
ncbi:MAG: hypothetical protein GY946_02780 [bacterium]|nr:hypothetical protein [bacterium]